MKIPHWAEAALATCRPLPPAWDSTGQPNQQALERFEAARERFRTQWYLLGAQNWKVPTGANPEITYRSILLAAMDCAKRIGRGEDPLAVLRARSELLRVDEQIADQAQTLAALFRQRTHLQNDYGVGSWSDWQPDPIDLWDALELCFCGPVEDPDRTFLDNAEIGQDIRRGLALARSTSRPVPEWGDILQQLGQRFERGRGSGEFPATPTQAGNTNRTRYSPWCNALIGMLSDWNLLECLSLPQLAALAMVALDAPMEAINPKQMQGLKRAFLKRQ